MKRRNFILATVATLPLVACSKMKEEEISSLKKGFKVNNGEARFGEHYKMKGVTLNNLDIKISGKDTNDNLAVFEQTGLTPNGGPPLHIHPFQDEWFYVVEGEYLFQVGEDKYDMKAGDTIFLPRNIQHAFIQLSEQGKMIVSYSPSGKMEAFFKLTNEWKSPPLQDEINKAFEDHGMRIVGKPLTRESSVKQ
jgi:quercetin dioxygenase-like cupin family protein